jgi:hypothetical protein
MDFTFTAYQRYLEIIKSQYSFIPTFSEIFSTSSLPVSYCMIRHDVDRKPLNALKMAELEKEMGLRTTYYFRTKANTFKPAIIRAIADMGHEVGYHYENLSDTNGDIERALKDFEVNLKRLREVVPIQTICMHGCPLKPFDNRDLWREKSRHSLLQERFMILGEAYLDIDYSDVAYINDTGRNWTAYDSNLRDKVNSKLNISFRSQSELINYLSNSPHPKLVFQIHPERWSRSIAEWGFQFCKDSVTNITKQIFRYSYRNKVNA